MGLCRHRADWGYVVHTSSAFPGIPWICLHHEVSLPYGLSVSSGSWWASQLVCQGSASATSFHVDVGRDNTLFRLVSLPVPLSPPSNDGRRTQRVPPTLALLECLRCMAQFLLNQLVRILFYARSAHLVPSDRLALGLI